MSRHSTLDYSDLHSPSSQQIENNSGVVILKGTAVRLDGFGTSFPRVKIANPAIYANFGIAQADIQVNARGMVSCLGLMRGLNTSAFTPGTPLYSTSFGVLSATPLGPVIATVLKQDAVDGILYVVASVDLVAGGQSTAWEVDGNAGTDPSINFIGTTDSQPLVLRTNGGEVLRATVAGRVGIGTPNPGMHVEQRSHSSSNASGIQQETYYLETNSILAQNAFTLNVANPEVVRFTFEALARNSDGSGRALFSRTGIAFRESSNVQLQGGTWQTDTTFKSNNDFNVSYVLGVGTITFRVKSSIPGETRWTGRVIVQRIN